MSHPVCADAVDGNNEVTWDEINLRCFAAWSDLSQDTDILTETEISNLKLHRLLFCSSTLFSRLSQQLQPDQQEQRCEFVHWTGPTSPDCPRNKHNS